MTLDWKLVGLIGLGSGLGGVARYVASHFLNRVDFPYGTLFVNVAGCFAIGLVVFGGMNGGWLSQPWRALAVVGFLGGFTTMSAFTYESVALFGQGAWRLGLLNVVANVALCLLGTWAGAGAGIRLWPRPV
ncbi:MAG: CrcB family protein [Euryarchaeota archaeon]|nr:CrcB family protein [Euryarchaeota archaeon]